MAQNKKSNKNQNPVPQKSIGFSSKGKKAPAPAVIKVEEKEKLTKNQIIIIIAVALVAVIISATIIGCVINSRKFDNPDFLNDDLSKYISISSADYKNYVIDIPLDSVSDADVMRKINALLCEHKTPNEAYKGGYAETIPLKVGNEAYIYYRGYTVDKDGKQIDLEGSSNFADEEHVILEIGTDNVIEKGKVSGTFISGFTDALIGVKPSDYEEFEKKMSGTVDSGDVVYLSYTLVSEKENKTASYERINLAAADIDEKYGEGFTAFLIGKTIGQKLEDKFIIDKEIDTVYSDIKVEFVTKCESAPLTIDVRFPANYHDKSFRGIDAKFDVYIKYAEVYDMPTYDEKFITDTLKVDISHLSTFEGMGMLEKHKTMIRSELLKKVEESNHELLAEEMWEHLLSKVEVKALPENTVVTHYNSYYREVTNSYSNYTDKFDTVDSFAIYYLNRVYGADLKATDNWMDYITDLAERDVTQKILFYYITREENLLPSEKEYQKIYNDIYNEILDYYLDLHEAEFSVLEGEEYEKELQILKDEIDSYYGESYFKERAYYYYGTRKMLSFAKISR